MQGCLCSRLIPGAYSPQAKNWKVDHWLIRLCTLPTTAPRQTSSMKALTAARVRSVQPVGRYTCTRVGLEQGTGAGRWSGGAWRQQ